MRKSSGPPGLRIYETRYAGALAQELGVEPRRLARAFRAKHGVPIRAFVQDMRIRLESLLERDDPPMRTIGAQ